VPMCQVCLNEYLYTNQNRPSYSIGLKADARLRLLKSMTLFMLVGFIRLFSYIHCYIHYLLPKIALFIFRIAVLSFFYPLL
jgi:hypothetical protein